MRDKRKLNKEKIDQILDKQSKILDKNINFETFVETGTHEGDTLEEIKNIFKNCYSIELSERYYDSCVKKFENDKNVKLFHGSSIDLLPNIFLNFYNEPVIFFLDAHYSGTGYCAKHDGYDPPILFEIETILKERKSNGFFNDIIVVDDLCDFGVKNGTLDWTSISISKIKKLIESFNIDSEIYPIDDDSQLLIYFKNIKEEIQ